MPSEIYLHNGRLVDPYEVEKYDFTAEDFIHPLALLNRYTGHTKYPYSVAEHTVLGSRIPEVIEKGLARAFVLHDFGEALTNDIAAPLKRQMPEFVAHEERVQKHIFRCFDEPWANMEAINYYDKNMCQDEMAQIFSFPCDLGRQSFGLKINFWHWSTAEEQLRQRCLETGVE